MKFTYLILSGLLTGLFLQTNAQSLYMPREIKAAYKNGTRSPDGKPGPNYWQNGGRYNISVTVRPPEREVKGTEQIAYFNNSPDTLKHLNFKVMMNIHKPGAARFFWHRQGLPGRWRNRGVDNHKRRTVQMGQ